LIGELPNYRTNITEKVRSVREMMTGSGELQEVIEEVQTEIRGDGKAKRDAKIAAAATNPPPAAPVTATESDEGPLWLVGITSIVAAALKYLGQMVVALVLATFILLKREDLRNRVLWLFGYGHVTSTTKAVEDGVRRISRFLLAQFFVNAGFGVALAVGLL